MTRIFLCLLALLAAAPARADVYGGFEEFADSGALRPFSRDLGGVLGSATYHSGRSLGFSGFDIGARVGAQLSPDKDDRILRNKGVRSFGLPWIQAEIGLPYRFDGFIRGISYEGLTIAGGGLRYGLLKSSDKAWAPQLLVSAVAHSVVHQHFSASHLGGNLVFSMGTPKFNPYLGAGLDRTNLVVRSSRLDPAINGATVTTAESRFTAGMRLRLWTFGYLNAAYNVVHGTSGAEAGLGVRF
ncbi:MAG TPA: hypothetical protein DEB40_09520 [Elusimicrobia bacterium]|nr:hypothetical protein [Elusimicrobiota bacterium]HBT61967.1 hypothetical protein [Elusimicrobiota bacterium]